MGIYSKPKKNNVWNFLNSTLAEFKAKLLGYREYSAVLTQTGVLAPVATVVENNLADELTWTYVGVGEYLVTSSSNVFSTTTGKTVVTLSIPETAGSTYVYAAAYVVEDTTSITLLTGVGAVATNALLTGNLITIKVYS